MSPSEPQLSVVIASHNRRDLLRRCLDFLAKQTADPADFEVLVADDGSDDGTAEMVEGLETPLRLRVLRFDKVGKSAALNAAIETVVAPACLFLDDDVVASPELVAGHLAAHRRDPSSMAIGALDQQPPDARDWYAHAYATAWNERYEELAHRRVHWSDCYGGNFSAPRAALLEVGGFAELPTAEDIELGFRLERAGCVPTFLPRAHGIHDDQKLRGRILRDAHRYGSACPQLVARAPAMRARTLNWFTQPTVRDVTLRRLLLALRVPPRALAAAGVAIPGKGRRQTWFSFISRYTFWLGVRQAMSRTEWLATTRGATVLMYHAFTDGGDTHRYILDRRSFARQMRVLAALRYSVISFEDLVTALLERRPIRRKTAVITIDDGYLDNLEVAQPILRRRSFVATIFLVSRRLSGSNDWDMDEATTGRPLLSAKQVLQMRDQGAGVGAHARTHPSLPDVPDDRVVAEVAGSRADLESELGEPVRTFAFPYGHFDRRAVTAVREAGYLGACTVENCLVHPGTDPLLVPRIEVKGTDSIWRFLRKLWFGGA